jgi:hypothetical protein
LDESKHEAQYSTQTGNSGHDSCPLPILLLVSCLLFLVYEGRMVKKNSDHKTCEYLPESAFAIVTFMNASAANEWKRSLSARQRRGWSWLWASAGNIHLIEGALRPGDECERLPQVIPEKNATVLSW